MAGKIPIPDDLTADFLGRYVRPAGAAPKETKLRPRLPNLLEGKAERRGGGRRLGTVSVSDYRRRVVVRMEYRKNQAPGAMSRLHTYIGYIQKPGKGEQQVSAGLFNATEDNVLGHSVVARWANDRHHFLPIIAPNDGDKIGNAEVARAKLRTLGRLTEERAAEIRAEAFRSYVREVVAEYEKALGTKLEWFAGVHEKADRAHERNRHAHVVVRGVADDGTDLVMDRNFIKTEMRRLAEEVATRRLGSMSAAELAEYRRRHERDRGQEQERQSERQRPGRGQGRDA